ncbi:MAG: peptidoglycan editing factor PgeF [Nitrospirae bacterium]|nr:peptidoglycan editing factor PgeF [Nitrospirota bacterium]
MEKVISPPVFNGLRVKGFFTTRAADIDTRGIPKLFDISLDTIYMPVQKHTDKVLVLDYDLEPKVADAVVTNRKDIFIGIKVADCVPVLLYDRKMHVIGAVHAGWRGTAAGILGKTIETMMKRFYSSPSDILVAVGPGIRWCCYEVGYEVIEAVTKGTGGRDYYKKKGEKYFIDLPTANRHQAISSGVLPENTWVTDECTFCLPEKYYSYRFAKGTTGRQCGVIGIV